MNKASSEKTSKAMKHTCTAGWAYEEGFAENVRLRDDGTVVLYDKDLIEDDAPGAGHSDKGCVTEPLGSGVRVRKDLVLREARARSARIVFYVNEAAGNEAGLLIEVNGHTLRFPPLKEAYPGERSRSEWQFLEIPVRWLKTGTNRVVLRSETGAEGAPWTLYIARADEFEDGGGAGRKPGRRSAKSKNGGRTWSRALGETDDVLGEYLLRLSLTRFVPQGVLTSPVMDLWDDPAAERLIKSLNRVHSASLTFRANVPLGTSVRWQVRTADTFDPHGKGWSAWKTVSERPGGSASIPGPLKRYLQWRAILATSNPLQTPSVKQVLVRTKVTFASDVPPDVFVVDHHNEKIKYSSIPFEYEVPHEPRLRELRRKYALDKIVEGAASDFEEMVLLRHWVAMQWKKGPSHGGYGAYPPWDALEIMRRARGPKGCGGMCMQSAIVLIQALISRGIHARHINKIHHEVVEAWSNEFKKWVFMDPTSFCDFHNYDLNTGEPLNVLEMHRAWLRKYVREPVDWRRGANQFALKQQQGDVVEQPIRFSTTNPTSVALGPRPLGYNNAGYLRMMPRNNYLSKPTPRPLAHGHMLWPWNGYVNWEDDLSGCLPQYAWWTDRERDFYPTLNQVQYDLTYGGKPGTLKVRMVTFTPGFHAFLTNVDDARWVESPADFTWNLHVGLNRIQMRPRNTWGRDGIISHLSVIYQPSD